MGKQKPPQLLTGPDERDESSSRLSSGASSCSPVLSHVQDPRPGPLEKIHLWRSDPDPQPEPEPEPEGPADGRLQLQAPPPKPLDQETVLPLRSSQNLNLVLLAVSWSPCAGIRGFLRTSSEAPQQPLLSRVSVRNQDICLDDTSHHIPLLLLSSSLVN